MWSTGVELTTQGADKGYYGLFLFGAHEKLEANLEKLETNFEKLEITLRRSAKLFDWIKGIFSFIGSVDDNISIKSEFWNINRSIEFF